MKSQLMKKSQNKRESFKKTERCLNRSCDQMDLILRKINHTNQRKKNAMKIDGNPVTMTLGMQLQVLEGMYNVYYKYAEIKAKELQQLSQECCEELAGFGEDKVQGQ